MRRRDDTPPVELDRDLAAIDAALAGERVDPAQTELGELALALRDERPRPRPEFAATLDERAAAGFTADPRPTPAVRPSLPRRAFLPALGFAASAALVAVIVLPLGGEPRVDGTAASGSATGTTDRAARAEEQATIQSTPQPGAGGGAAAGGAAEAAPTPKALSTPVSPPVADDVAPNTRARKVERSASLILAARPEQISDVADGVVRVTDRVGGFVLSSNVTTDDRRGGGAEFTLRVPTRRLSDALSDLSKLAHVRSRSQTADDITAEFNSTRERLTEARGERRALLRQLARANTPNETASIRARLRIVRSEIARAAGDLAAVQRRASFSTVDLAIRPQRGGTGGGGSWTPGDALHDATRVLAVALGVALVALAVALPLALLGLTAWAAGAALRRRRREGALDLA